MRNSDTALYRTRDIRICERQAIEKLGLTEDELMNRAGFAAFDIIQSRYKRCCIAVFCGSGNNAGDGYVLARFAHLKGWPVIIYQHKSPHELPPVARRAAESAVAEGIVCYSLEDAIDSDVELIVDALLGIGVEGNVRGAIAQAINVINESDLPVCALDVPSGLHADTGQVLGVCVQAKLTVTFIAYKTGLFTLDGPDQCGETICCSLALKTCIEKITPTAHFLNAKQLQNILAPRRKNSHKGDYGHILVVGGGMGMPGAVYLAALAALRIGAGMVTVATRPEYANGVLPALPEVMVRGVKTQDDLLPLLNRASVCILGPGLGEDPWAENLFSAVIASQLPLVVDASALRLLAHHPQPDDNWILTPHPGEAAALLASSIQAVQDERFQSAELLQKKYGGCVILKGVGTIVHAGDAGVYLCPAGNPGLATAGTGDVLSGVIGGLLAQGCTLGDAAKLGVWLHAKAGDDAIAHGVRGLLASDLMPYLRSRVNGESYE